MTSTDPIVRPGGTVGMLGGGQLGRMLSIAAARMGLKTIIFCPDEHAPASDVAAEWIHAAYEDADALKAFAEKVDVVTFEFENVPAEALDQLAALGAVVAPGPDALRVAQDRALEKEFLQRAGAKIAACRNVDSAEDLRSALKDIGLPAILKTRRYGYDGKGQTLIESDEGLETHWRSIGGLPAILEKRIPFAYELSVVAVRDRAGAISNFDPSMNKHEGGILRRSVAPAPVDDKIRDRAIRTTRDIITALDYVGALAVEYFVLDTGELLANEIAPRVHNTGHWTIDACGCDQFEQHIRAVCGWPMASTERFADAVMDNLIGDDAAQWRDLAKEPNARLHLYGKHDMRRAGKWAMSRAFTRSARSHKGSRQRLSPYSDLIGWSAPPVRL